jgi:UDP-N-acetylbacillosamine transaminase
MRVAEALTAGGIETRPLWKPLHTQPIFKDAQAYITGVSATMFERGLCLPSGNHLKPGDQAKVADIILQGYK